MQGLRQQARCVSCVPFARQAVTDASILGVRLPGGEATNRSIADVVATPFSSATQGRAFIAFEPRREAMMVAARPELSKPKFGAIGHG